MTVSIYLPYWKDLEGHQVGQHLKKVYGDLVSGTEPDYNFTLSVNLKSIPSDYGKKLVRLFDWLVNVISFLGALATKLSHLKFHALGAPFQKYFTALAEGKTLPPGKVRISEDTTLYFSSKADRVVVIYGLHSKEKFDEVVAKVFLNVIIFMH
jgi:actin related protein 2/3 complex subunit 2